MKVIKIGGGCLKGKETIKYILDLVSKRGLGHVFVVSALSGVTDRLINGISLALADEGNIPKVINRLKADHMAVAKHVIEDAEHLKNFSLDLNKHLGHLERYYYGLNFTRENTPRLKDAIASLGECLSARLLVSALRSRGLHAAYHDPRHIGLVTDGKFGDATADLGQSTRNFAKHLLPLHKKNRLLFIPGFFGISNTGDVTTFGRGGSDYSAAVVAVAVGAEILEVWKDVAGFMSADPKFVPEAQLIPLLSYEEAAELAYFGAKILHPRTVEPIRRNKLSISVKNTLNPDAPGSLISAHSPKLPSVIKSVAHDTDISVLKIHGSGVGARPGILARITGQLTDSGINIRSVVTSQTCISLILAGRDLEPGYQALKNLRPKPYRRLEKIKNLALVSIVGEGLLKHKGIAARCFTAVAESNVNVELISFGPSHVALYFLLRQQDLRRAVQGIHRNFFPAPQDDQDR